jgi:dTDP-4-amino-4,6-dideoxygalactose transaminase
LGCFSFHDTKNIHCGEGGAILINNKSLLEKVDIILEKGTNRAAFLAGEIDNYTWQSLGSSYGLSEINAAFLFAQLQELKTVTKKRKALYSLYQNQLQPLKEKGLIDFPKTANNHNAHIFFIKTKDLVFRNKLITHLESNGISAYFHYSPLHLSEMGKQYHYVNSGKDFSKEESEKLVRLPLFYGSTESDVELVCDGVKQFFSA